MAASMAKMYILVTSTRPIHNIFAIKTRICGLHTASILAAKETIPFEYVKKPKPTVAERSGDLQGLPNVDLQKPIYSLKDSLELQKTEDENVKKIFSLEFAPKSEVMKAIRWETIDRVRRHPYDTCSVEVDIAALTVRIRSLMVHTKQCKKDSKAKMQLKELIERRTKRLKYLQRWDLERFEWLLKELNIVYIPHSIATMTTRKITIREMTRAYCEDLRATRLTAYRKQLEAERESFLKEKEEAMKWIESEKKALGLVGSVKTDASLVDGKGHDRVPTLMAEVARIAGQTQSQSES